MWNPGSGEAAWVWSGRWVEAISLTSEQAQDLPAVIGLCCIYLLVRSSARLLTVKDTPSIGALKM